MMSRRPGAGFQPRTENDLCLCLNRGGAGRSATATLAEVGGDKLDDNNDVGANQKSVRKLRRIAEKLVKCAMNGEPWAISQVADRIDGKATAEIQTEQRHRYVIEAPPQLTREQWIAKHSPMPEVIPASPPTITQ